MIVAIYDVSGIQDFVFASRKMKENVGASHIVDMVLVKWLPEAIKEQFPSAKSDWENDFEMPSEAGNATIVYVGGGNAMVIYPDEKGYLEVNKILSKRILEETGNELQVRSAWESLDMEKDLSLLRKSLFDKLAIQKATRAKSLPLQGIGITRACASDGLPATIAEGGEYLSLQTSKKRQYAEKRIEHFERLFDGYSFPSLLDDLGGSEGNNFIAVVHIDGNSMGDMINKRLSACSVTNEWFKTMRNLSNQVTGAFQDAFMQMQQTLKRSQAIRNFQNVFDVKEHGMLLRPLVVNGDDITFVTDGRLGLSLAVEFLNRLKDKRIQTSVQESVCLSACAGIAIVKAHFPFYRAYALASELCSSAKRKGKIIDQDKCGSWIDWHIAHGGLVNDLHALRSRQYLVPGMDPASLNDVESDKFPLYNLLYRPWKIAEGDFDFAKLLELIKGFDKLPRSRWKALRNNAIVSKEAVENCIVEMNSRGFELPPFDGKKEFFPGDRLSNLTPYFDALETSEYYYELKKEGDHEQV